VFAIDTELLGHWWYEGVAWLSAVVEECSRQGLALLRLDDALERHEPVAWSCDGAHGASSWGQDGDLSTWSGPAAAEMAFAARAAELQVLAAGPRAGDAAVRELLALQASDWAFMVARQIAAAYASERFERHRGGLARALADGPQARLTDLRNIAVHVDRASLIAPQ
jgi:1,4-alpha-glucan branching enzyme